MTKKYYHQVVIGCQMNKSDSERIGTVLENLKYTYTTDKNKADLIVISTCGVRQSAEDRIYGLIPRMKKSNPKLKIVLSGCLSDRVDVKKRMEKYVDIFLNIKDLPKLEALLGNTKADININACDYLKIEPKYSSKISAYVPIGNGCDNFCTYCVVPYARGREVYRNPLEIIDEVRSLAQKGYKEIILIAQNVNSYNFPGSSVDFAELLKMIDGVEGDFWLRFATSHPKDMSDKLIETMSTCQKLCKHLHLPAQSGDNDILAAMNRKYKIEDYKNLIKKVRDKIPDIALTTDIIVGFPGESERQFMNTKLLFKEMNYDMAYIAQYSPRPGTAAESLEDNVSHAEKKSRENILMEELSRTARLNNQSYLDKKVEVLVEHKNSKGELVGKTKTFKTVKIIYFDNNEEYLHKVVNVKIVEVQDFGLGAEICL